MIAIIRCADPDTDSTNRNKNARDEDGKPRCCKESDDIFIVVVKREDADEEGYDG